MRVENVFVGILETKFSFYCSAFKTGMKCFDSYADTCLNGDERQVMNQNVAGARHAFSYLCDDPSFQTGTVHTSQVSMAKVVNTLDDLCVEMRRTRTALWKLISEFFSVDKKNQLMSLFCILYFSSNSCSTCFGQPCAHHQELTTA